MYRFRKESWVRKVLGQDSNNWTTSSHTIGYFHSKSDQLGWKYAINYGQRGRLQPPIDDRIAMGTSAQACLSWSDPGKYKVKQAKKGNTTYKSQVIRLDPIEKVSEIPRANTGEEEGVFSLRPAGVGNDTSGDGRIKLKPIHRKGSRNRTVTLTKGIPDNRVFTFRFKNPWKYSQKSVLTEQQ